MRWKFKGLRKKSRRIGGPFQRKIDKTWDELVKAGGEGGGRCLWVSSSCNWLDDGLDHSFDMGHNRRGPGLRGKLVSVALDMLNLWWIWDGNQVGTSIGSWIFSLEPWRRYGSVYMVTVPLMTAGWMNVLVPIPFLRSDCSDLWVTVVLWVGWCLGGSLATLFQNPQVGSARTSTSLEVNPGRERCNHKSAEVYWFEGGSRQ